MARPLTTPTPAPPHKLALGRASATRVGEGKNALFSRPLQPPYFMRGIAFKGSATSVGFP